MSADTPTDDERRPDWVSQRAVAWVIDEAPVPAELAWTLTVIARRCDKHGKGSRQTTKTIAAKAGKSVKQAQREIVRLRELGLIMLGDQSLVEHIPAGQRPTVYDVPLHVRGPKPQKESRNKSGLRKGAEPDQTPPMDGTPPLEGSPRMEGGSTPPIEGESTPPLEGSQKKTLKKPLNNPSLSSDRSPAAAPPEPGSEDRERDESASPENPNLTPQQRLVIEHGCPPHLAAQVVHRIEARNPGIRGIGWWSEVARRGDLPSHVQDALADIAASSQPAAGGRCPDHPSYPAGNCGPCRSDRIGVPARFGADLNQQPRTSQRMSASTRKYLAAQQIGAELDAELGIRRAGQDQPYRNPTDQSAYDAWPNAHLILDAEPEATP